ncbi:hypothetical protein [Desulfoscipio gibsoniae]|uniref:Uncharacterized protein n=1 Tax=Desulfoscipio gibsoniae DSM 7213 TaxID=767817 RepID=R4KP75_9FIRM|nr:hypothetical protein [Desulfoscipio gibsoniae]AGL03362.1 hypothetical protein Desgi_4107 [Desulfoscipio gibsoniae DSM 7213]
MYYIAGVNETGMEMGCDFGFDMIERIVLDDILMEIPSRAIGQLVAAKRFSYFGDKPDFKTADLVGQKAQRLQAEYGIDVLREHCQSVLVVRRPLLATLKRMRIKLWNLSGWRCGLKIKPTGLFNHIVLFHPQLLRSLLGKEKYGLWNHAEDQVRAIGVLDKFIDFLEHSNDLRKIIFYNELTCPHWDASGEMEFDSIGRLMAFNYFGRGNGQSYKYYPQLEVWQRT